MDDDRFDGMFLQVTQQAQGIEGFFNAFFGFLRRKTDYYTNVSGAQELLQKQFNLHQHAYSEQKRKEEARKKKQEELRRKKEEERQKREEVKEEPKVVELTEEEAENYQQGIVQEEEKKVPPKADDSDKDEEEKKDPDDDLPDPVNNGGFAERYFWTQTFEDITINFYIEQGVRGRDCQVDYGSEMLRVRVRGETLCDGEFWKKIKPDGLVWTIDTIEKHRVLSINADKYEGAGWWKGVIKGGPEINAKKIGPAESKLSDIEDDDARQTVEKMMEDNRRKSMGLPSIAEQKKRDKLSSFMKAHPEMDFSNCKFN